MRLNLVVFAAAFISLSAWAQNPSGGDSRTVANLYFAAGPISTTVVTGSPYSAEGVSQSIQTQADGAHVPGNSFSLKFYRDSLGRTRREGPFSYTNVLSGIPAWPPPFEIEITDPVAQLKYTLDPVKKQARRQRFPAPAPRPELPRAPHSEQPQPPESLGAQTIEGVLCEGTKTTTIWPVGSRGNDQSISTVSEVWKSSELQLVLLSKFADPETGELTEKLVNLNRAEPPPELFQPPSDYMVIDQVGGNVSAPRITHKVEPKYSAEARKAKFSGSVLLSIVVDQNGLPRDIKVVRPLGLGLDQRAIEAVKKWRFHPGMKDGHPVPVAAQVEVSFRLL